MKAQESILKTVARLAVPILAVVVIASSVSSATAQADVPVVSSQADTHGERATPPLAVVVPEPPWATPAGPALDVPRATVTGRSEQGAAHLQKTRVSQDGQRLGRLAVIVRRVDTAASDDTVTVHLVQSGVVVAQGRLDDDGVFQMDVQPGVYSVVTVGSGGFAALGMHVRPPANVSGAVRQVVATQGGRDPRETTSIQIVNLVAVPRAHFGVLEHLLEEQVRIGPRLAQSTSEPIRVEEQRDQSRLASTSIHEPMNEHTVRLRQDGRLVGRMRRLHLETGRPVAVSPLSVFFIRDGVSTEKATADENGRFELSGLEPGTYSFVAIGPDGFAAFDVLVLPPRGVVLAAGQDHVFRTVADSRESQDAPELLDGSLVALQDVQQVLLLEDQSPPPMDTPRQRYHHRSRGRGGHGRSGVLGRVLLGAGIGAAVGAGVGLAIDDDDVSSPF